MTDNGENQPLRSVFGDDLKPPYSTIVADPPWPYRRTWGGFSDSAQGGVGVDRPMQFSEMTIEEITCLPVESLVGEDAHLYLWTTTKHLRAAYEVAEGWGFRPPGAVLTWCKAPMGLGLGGAYTPTTEFVLFCRRGSLPVLARVDTTWWEWKRGSHHSAKPDAFGDLVEQVSPGPYVELFCRRPRLGWDHWGHGYEIEADARKDRRRELRNLR